MKKKTRGTRMNPNINTVIWERDMGEIMWELAMKACCTILSLKCHITERYLPSWQRRCTLWVIRFDSVCSPPSCSFLGLAFVGHLTDGNWRRMVVETNLVTRAVIIRLLPRPGSFILSDHHTHTSCLSKLIGCLNLSAATTILILLECIVEKRCSRDKKMDLFYTFLLDTAVSECAHCSRSLSRNSWLMAGGSYEDLPRGDDAAEYRGNQRWHLLSSSILWLFELL
jgi:hypothetical protein